MTDLASVRISSMPACNAATASGPLPSWQDSSAYSPTALQQVATLPPKRCAWCSSCRAAWGWLASCSSCAKARQALAAKSAWLKAWQWASAALSSSCTEQLLQTMLCLHKLTASWLAFLPACSQAQMSTCTHINTRQLMRKCKLQMMCSGLRRRESWVMGIDQHTLVVSKDRLQSVCNLKEPDFVASLLVFRPQCMYK